MQITNNKYKDKRLLRRLAPRNDGLHNNDCFVVLLLAMTDYITMIANESNYRLTFLRSGKRFLGKDLGRL
jgi:hypothetical protein